MQLFRAFYEEFDAIFRDAGVLLIFLGGLLIYSLTYPLPYSTQTARDVPVVLVDRDHSALSRKLIRFADATEDIRFSATSGNIEDAERLVRDQEAYGIFVIPEGFEKDVLRGKQATVAAYADATNFLLYRRVLTGLGKAAGTLSAGVEIKRMTAAGLTYDRAFDARDPVPVNDLPLYNPAGGYASYVVPGVLPIVLQQTLLIGMCMLGGTRRERWRLAPPEARAVPQGSVLAALIGRTLAYFSFYIFYPVFFIGVVFYVYDLPRPGDLFAVMLFSIPYVLSVVLFGQAINTFLFEREHSLMIVVGTSIPFVFLAGFAWPIDAQPEWLHYLGILIPCISGVPGFLRINQMNASLSEVFVEWKVLWGLCALYFVLAYLGMRFTGPMRLCPAGKTAVKAVEVPAET